jgi:DNA-binding PadR family transcriptional regulator
MDELSRSGSETIESRINRAIVGALRGRDLSGFEIWRWLGSDGGTFALLSKPALYPTLYRLEAERLLQSDWHEGERTRRTYRLTATALELAEENCWPALPFRGPSSPHVEPARPARLASPDPEAGSWFVPPQKDPLVAAATDPFAADCSSWWVSSSSGLPCPPYRSRLRPASRRWRPNLVAGQDSTSSCSLRASGLPIKWRSCSASVRSRPGA